MVFAAQIQSAARDHRSGPCGVVDLFVVRPADLFEPVAAEFAEHQRSTFSQHDVLAVDGRHGTASETCRRAPFHVDDLSTAV